MFRLFKFYVIIARSRLGISLYCFLERYYKYIVASKKKTKKKKKKIKKGKKQTNKIQPTSKTPRLLNGEWFFNVKRLRVFLVQSHIQNRFKKHLNLIRPMSL